MDVITNHSGPGGASYGGHYCRLSPRERERDTQGVVLARGFNSIELSMTLGPRGAAEEGVQGASTRFEASFLRQAFLWFAAQIP